MSKFVDSPLFLVGAERSGTTMLRLMLNAHPQIAWCSEFEYAVDNVQEPGKWPDLKLYRSLLETNRIFLSHNFSVDPHLDYPQLVNSFLLQRKTITGKPLIGATVHRHYDRLLWIWPSARFIHLVRDPRDVAQSCIGMGWAGNVWRGVDRWVEAETLWRELRVRISPDSYLDVQFEDLVSKPEETLSQVCTFIGVVYDGAMLTYSETTTYDKPDPKLVFKWRKKMSERDIRLVESKIQNLITQPENCYEISDFPPLKLSEVEKKILNLQNWWVCKSFRIRRLGFKLFLMDFLSRKLGHDQWQRNIKLKINEVEKGYLK